jgi:SPP1 gp7 family putative phage head morphogenesis protein
VTTTTIPQSVETFLARLDRLVPNARAEVHSALASAGASVNWSRVERALTRRDYRLAAELVMVGVDHALPLLDTAAKQLLAKALTEGGTVAAARFGAVFDLLNPEAIRWARERAGALILEIRNGTFTTLQRQVQQIVTRSQLGDLTARAAARQIRGLIGLDPRRAQALVNYTTQLYASTTGKPLTEAAKVKLDAKAERYGAKLLRQRADTIARTETLAAGNHGQLVAWQQAEAAGLLPPNRVKRWSVGFDERLCPKCRPWHGKVAALDQPFGNGLSCPPLHPSCRCCLVLVRDPRLAKVTV